MTTSDKPRVIVVGAGIAGLAAAFRLQQGGCHVNVIERSGSDRVGGRMASVEREGFYVDLGAPLLAKRYHRMFRLMSDIGIGDHVVPSSDEVGVLCRGTILRGRTGTPVRMLRSGILETIDLWQRLRLLNDMRQFRRFVDAVDMSRAAALTAESVIDYTHRRRFPTDTVEYILDPMNSTMCLGDPQDSSAVSPFLMLMFFAGGGGLFTFSSGSGFLPRQLATRLSVDFDAEVTSVEETSREVVVTWRSPDGTEQLKRADAAVLAIPGYQMAQVFGQLHPEQFAYFSHVAYAPLVQITFCLDRPTAESSVVFYASRADLPDIAAFVLQHNLSPRRVPPACGMITTYLRAAASRARWDTGDAEIVAQVASAIGNLGILPEIERHTIAVHVDRIWPSVLARRPDDYSTLARIAALTRVTTRRVHLATGELFGHSTTIGSLTAGERAAERVLAGLAAEGH